MAILDVQLIVRTQLVFMYDNFDSLFNPVPLTNILILYKILHCIFGIGMLRGISITGASNTIELPTYKTVLLNV